MYCVPVDRFQLLILLVALFLPDQLVISPYELKRSDFNFCVVAVGENSF